MTLRKLMFLFFSTLGIGAASAFVLNAVGDLAANGVITGRGLIFGLVPGALYGAIGEAGFFAYLMLNYIAIDIFRRKYWWNFFQVFVIIVFYVDILVFRTFFFKKFTNAPAYLGIVAFIGLAGLAVSWWKVKLTNASAFVPTLFFMIILTLLEAVPGLQQGGAAAAAEMALTLCICNSWQILQLHRLVKPR